MLRVAHVGRCALSYSLGAVRLYCALMLSSELVTTVEQRMAGRECRLGPLAPALVRRLLLLTPSRV